MVRPGVKVDVNTTIRVDMKLEVGQMTEAVSVVAESPLFQTDRTDTGRIIESKMVTDIPLTFNRNFQSMLITVPGSTRPHREHSQFFNSQDSLAVEVNGQPRLANNTLIEGLDNNHKTGLLQVIIPAADALETVSVSTSNYDAEFGRSGGAVTNVTLKSGTNDLRGSAFFFGNTDATIAPGSAHRGQGADEVREWRHDGRRTDRPQPGVLLRRLPADGGQQRLRRARDRADDGHAQRRFQRRGAAHLRSVHGQHRQHRPVRSLRTTQIPPERISAIARRLLAFIPEPNFAAMALGQNNFVKAQTREKTTDGFDAKDQSHAERKKIRCPTA